MQIEVHGRHWLDPLTGKTVGPEFACEFEARRFLTVLACDPRDLSEEEILGELDRFRDRFPERTYPSADGRAWTSAGEPPSEERRVRA